MAEKSTSHVASRIEKDERLRLLALAVAVVAAIAVIVALVTPNVSGLQRCNGVVLSLNREQCLYQLALSSDNSTLCGNLSEGDSNSCYLAVAEATKNESLCYRIGYMNSTASCVKYIANATDSYTACNGLDGTYKDSCIGAIALKDDNADICAQISSQFNRTVCSSSVAF